ncbi:LLM class flavin-dependent oxidoreductase [Mycolicibacterium sp. P9-64]|uniref:LLM class flavin-dependent oxidoreductase n=1 Tax=Mycolicibacterium sp. P9-64 TaxID=2024612 RepID=UPI0018D6B32B|nr:LLM class flavin-dependent oxidoreductase [Mycolicibacterium sp. P9-64]
MSNPIYNDNRLKLGIFCTNGGGANLTLVPEATRTSWDFALRTARVADQAGYEAVVPFSRWKGYPPNRPEHYSGEVFDPFTFAAGIAQATEHVGIFATSHAPTIHPIVVAKQSATVDAISGGRFSLNVVAGWNKPELDMFGADMRQHEQRYAQLAEWVKVLRLLWSEREEFDFDGDFYTIRGAVSQPKPIQKRPPLMNAGTSAAGARFATENADLCFVLLQSEDESQIKAQVDQYKNQARNEFGREVKVWVQCFVVQRDSQGEADDYLQRYAVDYQDREGVDAWMSLVMANTQGIPPEVLQQLRLRFAAGCGGYPLVGTTERIGRELEKLSRAGLDGVLLTWVDYDQGMAQFNRTVLPALEVAGLRQPFRPSAGSNGLRRDEHSLHTVGAV